MKARTIASLFTALLAVLTIAASAALPAVAATTTMSSAVRGTPVTRIRVLVNLNIRTGPSTRFRAVDKLWPGEQATVTGLSDNYNWWRIRCPWGGTCWVSANPYYSKPVAWRR